jgi:hypothetical protein
MPGLDDALAVITGLDPVIHEASRDCSALRKPEIAERPHGLPGQVYDRAALRADPVARQ